MKKTNILIAIFIVAIVAITVSLVISCGGGGGGGALAFGSDEPHNGGGVGGWGTPAIQPYPEATTPILLK
ncbi:MAG: hypothetical protein GX297_09010 [Treponema sp.]|jgi:preprotein translocase subunit SecG|nr:hypothetical protein [Treponema sp.]